MNIILQIQSLKKDLAHIFRFSQRIFLIGPLDIDQKFKLAPDGIIFIDGGLKHFNALQELFCNIPRTSIGDGDSTQDTKQIDHLFTKNKDLSDLKLSLDSLPENITHLELYGLEGGRNDHFLCNLGEIHNFLESNKRNIQIGLYGKTQNIIATNERKFTFQCQTTFSLLSLSDNSLDIEGDCEYTGKSILLRPFSSKGLSNKGRGEIIISSIKPIFIIISHVE
jgi:thiamine pyrophosphokinase